MRLNGLLHKASWINIHTFKKLLKSSGFNIKNNQYAPDIHQPLGTHLSYDIAVDSTLVVQIPAPFNFDAVVLRLENWASDSELGITSIAVALAQNSLDDGTELDWIKVYTAGQKSHFISRVAAGLNIPVRGHLSDLTILGNDSSYSFLQIRIYLF